MMGISLLTSKTERLIHKGFPLARPAPPLEDQEQDLSLEQKGVAHESPLSSMNQGA